MNSAVMSLGIIMAGALLGLGCGAPQKPPMPPPPISQDHRGKAATTKASPDKPRGVIEGVLERKQRQKRIWGEVERIRQGEHTQLPPLTATPTGGGEDPVTEIRNQTTLRLTIWFAGECSHQVEIPSNSTITAAFCPGTYHIAAMVDNEAFLPLVRENQAFEPGVRYKLDFFVQKPPQ